MHSPQGTPFPLSFQQQELWSPLAQREVPPALSPRLLREELPLPARHLSSPHQQPLPPSLASPLHQCAFPSRVEHHVLPSPQGSPLSATFSPVQDRPTSATESAATMQQDEVQQRQTLGQPGQTLSPAARQANEIFEQIFTKAFTTKEGALEACKALAWKCGFGVRRRTSKATAVYIVCSCEGRPIKKRMGVRQRNRISDRCSCDWKVIMFQSSKSTWRFRPGKCMMHNHLLMHNHPPNNDDLRPLDSSLIPPSSPHLERTLPYPPMLHPVMTGMLFQNVPDLQMSCLPLATSHVPYQAFPKHQQFQAPHFPFAHDGYPQLAMRGMYGKQSSANLVGLGIMPPDLSANGIQLQQGQVPLHSTNHAEASEVDLRFMKRMTQI